jgi:hypothetical protein
MVQPGVSTPKAQLNARPFDGRMAFVPEGRCDRSLARSAWDSATQKSRPLGYGLIRAGVRTDSMIGLTKFRARNQKNIGLDSSNSFWHFVPGYHQPVPQGRNTFSAPRL